MDLDARRSAARLRSAARAGRAPAPAAGPGEVLVRVTAAAVVPLDLLCATGTSYFGPPRLPYVPGVQGAASSSAGTAPAPGTRVWFSTDAGMRPGDGSLAEAAVVPADRLVLLPPGGRGRGAAALGLSAVAAWMALTWRGRPARRGSGFWSSARAAPSGRSPSGRGRCSAPPASSPSSRREAARERALLRGADAVADLAGADVDELERRMRAAAGGEVDVVLDPVCGDAATAALRVLAEHGRLVNLGSAGDPRHRSPRPLLRSGSHSILGYTNTSLTPQHGPRP